jgi:hypothetical protein
LKLLLTLLLLFDWWPAPFEVVRPEVWF